MQTAQSQAPSSALVSYVQGILAAKASAMVESGQITEEDSRLVVADQMKRLTALDTPTLAACVLRDLPASAFHRAG